MPLLIISLLIILDQLSKYLVRQWGGFYICNEGIAFGLTISPYLFWIFWITIIAFAFLQIFNFLRQPADSISNFSISKTALYLILAGAFSNIIDRLYFNCVIDFINIPFWPAIFNLADVFITIGAIMALRLIFKSKH